MKTKTIQCAYYIWKLFQRGNIYYADGRGNQPGLGKHSLNCKELQAAIVQLKALDCLLAEEHGLIERSNRAVGSEVISIAQGWKAFRDHCARPEALGGTSTSTQKRYRAVSDKHMAFCAGAKIIHWGQITNKNLAEYGRSLSDRGYSVASLYLELTTIKTLVKWMISEKMLPETARLTLQLRRSFESDAHCYSREEVDAMISQCRASSEYGWLGEILIVLATTGMRIGELVSLRRQNIQLDADCIALPDNRFSKRAANQGSVQTTKGGRGRRIPMNPDCKAAILRLLQKSHTDGFVFHGPKGGRLKADNVRTAFIKGVIEPLRSRFPTSAGDIGFEHGRLHSFRHYFISETFRRGASESHIRDWVGHRDSRIIERYRHLKYADSANQMQQLDLITVKAESIPAAPLPRAKRMNP